LQRLDISSESHYLVEIGTGSGYQAAVLAKITDQVYTIEIIEELAERDCEVLDKLGYTSIETEVGVTVITDGKAPPSMQSSSRQRPPISRLH